MEALHDALRQRKVTVAELSRAVDRVRERFGDDAIRAGRSRRRPVGEAS